METRTANPVASEVVLEAGATEAQAQAMIAVAWEQAETFTGRTYYPVTAGTVVLKVRGPELYTWPRCPFPSALDVQVLINGEFVDHVMSRNLARTHTGKPPLSRN